MSAEHRQAAADVAPTVEDIANAIATHVGGGDVPPADLTFQLDVRRNPERHGYATSGGQLYRLAHHVHTELFGLEAAAADPTMGRLCALNAVSVAAYQLDPAVRQEDRPDGTGGDWYRGRADAAHATAEESARDGRLAWKHVLLKQVFEALAESDPAALRAELIKVAAVAATWVEAIDRRSEQP